jgi:hypothetical protein
LVRVGGRRDRRRRVGVGEGNEEKESIVIKILLGFEMVDLKK